MREVIVISVLVLVWLLWRALNSACLQDAFSPFNMLFYFWVAPLIASFLHWSGLQNGLSAKATVLITVATAILVGGCILPMFLLRGQDLPASLRRYGQSWESTLSARMFILLFFMVTCTATIAAEFSRGIPLAEYAATIATSSNLHRFGKDSRLQILAGGLGVAGLLSFYVALTARNRPTKWFFYTIAAIPPLLGVLKTSKSDVFDAFFYYGVLYYYYLRRRHRRFPVKKLAICALIALVMFAGITILRLSGDSRNPTLTYSRLIDFRYQDRIPWPAGEVVAMPYGYMALNFENFSRFVSSSSGRLHPGTSMLRPFLSALMQGRIARSMVQTYEANYNELSGAANMGTYLRDLYFEGGGWFCIAGTVLYTALINFVYIRFRRRQSTLWMCIYINFLFAWIWIGFNNFFAVLTVYANAAFIVMVIAAAAVFYRATHEPLLPSISVPQNSQTGFGATPGRECL